MKSTFQYENFTFHNTALCFLGHKKALCHSTAAWKPMNENALWCISISIRGLYQNLMSPIVFQLQISICKFLQRKST